MVRKVLVEIGVIGLMARAILEGLTVIAVLVRTVIVTLVDLVITHWVSDHFGTLSRNCRLLLKSGRGLIGLIPQYSSGDDLRTLSSEYISSGE